MGASSSWLGYLPYTQVVGGSSPPAPTPVWVQDFSLCCLYKNIRVEGSEPKKVWRS